MVMLHLGEKVFFFASKIGSALIVYLFNPQQTPYPGVSKVQCHDLVNFAYQNLLPFRRINSLHLFICSPSPADVSFASLFLFFFFPPENIKY